MKNVGTFRRRISWLVGLCFFGGSFLLEGPFHWLTMAVGILLIAIAFTGSRQSGRPLNIQ